MKILFLFLCVTALSGCVTSRQLYTPNGKIGHIIDCPSEILHWGMCYEKAGKLCEVKGYEVLERIDDDSQGELKLMHRSMIVQCKE